MSMSIIESGSIFQLYANDNVKVGTKLPAIQMVVRFSKFQGFYLEKFNGFTVNEKIFGNHEELAARVLASYNVFERNLGVILSGDKGIGKTLFAKILCEAAMENDLPVIICDTYYPGIANFINDIRQNAVVLFDEYDKNFTNGQYSNENNGRNDPQTEMLTLFDGVASCEGKKLFIVTCNNTRNVSEFIINRPGRFHYHIRFEYPKENEIEIYLKDKVDEKYWDQILEVKKFASRVDLNYDCLRAIAFELNNGVLFKEAIKYLNIVNNNERYEYMLTLRYTDGTILKKKFTLNLFDEDNEIDVWLPDEKGEFFTRVVFDPSVAKYEYVSGTYIVRNGDFEIYYETDDGIDPSKVENYKKKTTEKITLKRIYKSDNIHFKTV